MLCHSPELKDRGVDKPLRLEGRDGAGPRMRPSGAVTSHAATCYCSRVKMILQALPRKT
jgi:hypothetical protein